MKVLIVALIIAMSSTAFALEDRSASDKIYVPVLEQKIQKCNEKVSTFQVKEEALVACKGDLAQSQKEFFKMNVTWIKGVLVGIVLAIVLI